MRKKLNQKNASSARTEDELKKMRKNALVKLAAMGVILATIIAFWSTAWFTMNREVEGTGANMTASDMPFELRTEGVVGYSDAYLPQGENGYALLSDAEGTGTLTTSGNQQKIEWLVTDTYNANNYGVGKSSEQLGIRPGSSGVLHFWIVPKNQETMTFRFTMQVTPYKKEYPVGENGNLDYDAEPTAEPLTETEADKALANYVDSHILFFRYKGDNPDEESNTKYSNLIDDSIKEEITFERDSEGNLQPYEVKIYWIWPETLGEAVLTDSATRTAVCATSDDGNNELLTKLNSNPSGFLKDYTFPTGITSLTQEDITNDYTALSIRYNNADQEIGDNIMHLLAEMIVALEA